jgi:ABC-2 type transport system ATP-binding protein
MDRLGLAGKKNATFDKLSGGQKQRLSVALALVGDPKVAVLDELTTGLDPAARREVWALITDIRDRGVTVVLVTHFMAEAERLCDRVAVIDGGRVTAIDTPAGLAASAAGQRIRFRLPAGAAWFDPDHLRALPDVTAVRVDGARVEVDGTDNALTAVTTLLARAQVVVADLRVDQATLDDAFVALTDHHRPSVEETSA